MNPDPWIERLRRTLNRQSVLIVLRELGLTGDDIATATDADGRTVRRWLDGQEPAKQHDEAVDRLRTAVLYLLQRRAMPVEDISLWLRSRSLELGPDPVLGVRRPLDALREGKLADVIGAADAFIRPAEPLDPLLPERYAAQLLASSPDREDQMVPAGELEPTP